MKRYFISYSQQRTRTGPVAPGANGCRTKRVERRGVAKRRTPHHGHH